MSRTEDRQKRRCPVVGCPNDEDKKLGLCWRHRQFVPKAMITAIRQRAETLARNLGRESTDRYRDECRRDLAHAIDTAAAAAAAWERRVKSNAGAP